MMNSWSEVLTLQEAEMFSFIRGLFVAAVVAVLVFLGASVLFGSVALNAASNYGHTHDMSIEVNPADILKLNPDQTWQTFCAGDRDPSWDAVCSHNPSEIGSIRDAISSPEEFLRKLAQLPR